MKILGISAFYHDSSASLLIDGELIAAAQEERFSRIKHDSSFPVKAIEFCLSYANLTIDDIDHIAYYENSKLKFSRLYNTYLHYAPKGLDSFLSAVPLWLSQKLWIPKIIKRELKYNKEILYCDHHTSHAASAFYPSPYEKAAFLTIDGVGEWNTTSYGIGEKNKLKTLGKINFPHSLGMLYSAFTYYLGFKVNSGEYKVMGLAPYGEPKYTDKIKNHLIDIKEDGSFWLDMEYFNYCQGLTMTSDKFHDLFGVPPRKPESQISQFIMDLAASLQVVLEESILKIAKHIYRETNCDNLVLAGGVALNCVSNGNLLKNGPFKNIWIQPAAGDQGCSLGAALNAYYSSLNKERNLTNNHDSMKGGYLGPSFENREIINYLDSINAIYEECTEEVLVKKTAEMIDNEKVIGWFQGRMEFGPRALGSRSIIGDPRSPEMQSKMNLKIKYRESFRPFAPSVLDEDTKKYFDIKQSSPYMLLVSEIRDNYKAAIPEDQKNLEGLEKLKQVRSKLTAITHVNYSARVQSVSHKTNSRYYKLLKAFKKLTDCSVMINTSFNVRGEPIVCSPEDAYRCFMRTEMDALVIGNFILHKEAQPHFVDKTSWQTEYDLD